MNGKKWLKYFSTEVQKMFWKSYKNRRMMKMAKVFFYRSSKSISAKSFWKSYEKWMIENLQNCKKYFGKVIKIEEW